MSDEKTIPLCKQIGDSIMRDIDETEAKQAKEMADAGVPDEKHLRESKAPWPKTETELTDYIKTLVDRPHDYGTCVYAMSLAATATFNYVASKLGCSGFQAGCADMDIIRRTRDIENFSITVWDNLLYPQYCNDEMPGWKEKINDPKTTRSIKNKIATANI